MNSHSTALRGLNERIAYAQHKFAQPIDPHVDEDRLSDIHREAVEQGYHDYRQGRYDVPVLYRDVRFLASAWKEGQSFASGAEELSNCPCCQDAHGDPCPAHG